MNKFIAILILIITTFCFACIIAGFIKLVVGLYYFSGIEIYQAGSLIMIGILGLLIMGNASKDK